MIRPSSGVKAVGRAYFVVFGQTELFRSVPSTPSFTLEENGKNCFALVISIYRSWLHFEINQ